MSLAEFCPAFLHRHGNLVSFFHHHSLGGLFFSSSTVTSARGEKYLRPHIVVEYLIESCGFSSAEASKASKYLAHLKSTKRADAFLMFMRKSGFDDASLRKIVSWRPSLLCCREAEMLLAPKFRFFQDLGISNSGLVQVILSNPNILMFSLRRTIQPRLEFWRGLLSSEEHFLKMLKSYARFLSTSVEKTIMPNLLLLRECGISDRRTVLVVRKSPLFILRSPQKFKALMERAEEMGVPRSSKKFLWVCWAVHLISEDKFNDKLRVMRGFGWSEAEFFSAFRKDPLFVANSAKLLSAKMAFLVKEVGYEPSEVALSPKLLTYSLENRLKPRHRVIRTLKKCGLLSEKYSFNSAMGLSEKVFMEKHVIPQKDNVPGLLGAYVAACGKGGTI